MLNPRTQSEPGPSTSAIKSSRIAEIERQNRVLEEIVANQKDVRPGMMPFGEFMDMKPPTFKFAKQPLEAKDWLSAINAKLSFVHYD